MSDPAWYELRDASQLLTPCLMVYPEIIRSNFEQAIAIAGNAARLRPHVKTHKTPEIVRIALDLGITKHKCATLMEADMLAATGAPDVLIAYPLVGPAVLQFAALMKRYPGTTFRCVVDNPVTLKALSETTSRGGIEVDVLIDIDCGMHRTGIEAGKEAVQLYQMVSSLPGVTPGGLHVYDGHNHQISLEERQKAVADLWRDVQSMIEEVKRLGLPVPRLVCGGTPTFPVYAAMRDIDVECSPGTCALSDFNYGRNYQDMSAIRHAAVLLARVISRCSPNRLTLDLGYKAVSGDQPAGRRCHILNIPEAKEVGHSEEHLVIESPHADGYTIGDLVYALPAHVCPTVALHSHLQVVENGAVVNQWYVAARDRFYRLDITD